MILHKRGDYANSIEVEAVFVAHCLVIPEVHDNDREETSPCPVEQMGIVPLYVTNTAKVEQSAFRTAKPCKAASMSALPCSRS